MKKALLSGVIAVCLATIPVRNFNNVKANDSGKMELLPIFLSDMNTKAREEGMKFYNNLIKDMPKEFHSKKLGKGLNRFTKEKLQNLPPNASISSEGKVLLAPSTTEKSLLVNEGN
ncbi:hypothetical protein J2Z48_000049 [Croceifilum oryzae]|uniref:Uncharacterized protein n=1 Tax=Croceifilum oryzae TaxID=1553429 RepID=A0AAJ1TJI6_9BACL|nr:hypothetical protein [Croceifilum oryzae]MDQ0415891.1 hypothetical protein [Croceifilum oryzae]